MVAKKLSAAVEATRLLGKWTKLAQGHVMFGSGCSCGVGFGTLRLQDFEQQILDYLHTKHGAAALERAGYRQGEAGSVTALLRAIATQGAVGQPAGPLALLADLERSIDSFDELHRGS
ncbi:MAG: hypothetical protein E6H62_04670 [Betaproteobacteria bacterium]|nr:MAG: hypothetical protein E6H62_04670 [Betaproteobacteria bacterium]